MISRYFPAFRYRNFRIFWVGQFFSLVGTWMQAAILPYLAYRLTGQPILLGAIGFATTIPMLLITLPGGVLIERLDKRRTVIALQIVLMLCAFLLAFLTLTHKIGIIHIIAISFLVGSANALEITARQSMFIDLVDKEALSNAIALNSLIFNAARVLGPSLAAPFLIFLQENGEGWAFFANGVSYLFVIGGLFLIRTRSKIDRSASQRGMEAFKEGQKFIRTNPTIGLMILLITIPGFFAFPFIQQIPVFARDVFSVAGEAAGMGATRNSILLTAQGVGAFIASILIAVLSTIKRKPLFLVIGQYIFSLSMIALSFVTGFSGGVIFMVFIGFGLVTQLIMSNTLIQLFTPDSLRGRVISTFLWAIQGVAPFGSLFIGWITQNWGISIAVLVGGAVCLLGQTALHLYRPGLIKIKA